jgi:hypothetical protein
VIVEQSWVMMEVTSALIYQLIINQMMKMNKKELLLVEVGFIKLKHLLKGILQNKFKLLLISQVKITVLYCLFLVRSEKKIQI